MEINGGEAQKKLKNVQYAGTRSHVNVCVTDIVAKAGSAWVDSGKIILTSTLITTQNSVSACHYRVGVRKPKNYGALG